MSDSIAISLATAREEIELLQQRIRELEQHARCTCIVEQCPHCCSRTPMAVLCSAVSEGERELTRAAETTEAVRGPRTRASQLMHTRTAHELIALATAQVASLLLMQTSEDNVENVEFDVSDSDEPQSEREESTPLHSDGELALAVCRNIRDAINILPAHSIYRTRLREALIRGLTPQEAQRIIGGAMSRFYPSAHPRAPRPATIRRRQECDDRDRLWAEYLSLHATPHANGTYRQVVDTKAHFYLGYCQYSTNARPDLSPLSRGTVQGRLQLLHIHWESNPLLCPHCVQFSKIIECKEPLSDAATKELVALRNHEFLKVVQRGVFHAQLHELSSSQDPTRLVALQDFTTLPLEKGHTHDLVVVVYQYDRSMPGDLRRHYLHILPDNPKRTNNVAYVRSAWNKLLNTPPFSTATSLSIWSDGGPKHFKVGNQMQFWCDVQRAFAQRLRVSYHFFPSYHGESACDAEAHHMKQRMQSHRRNTHRPIPSIAAIEEIEMSACTKMHVTIDTSPLPTTVYDLDGRRGSARTIWWFWRRTMMKRFQQLLGL